MSSLSRRQFAFIVGAGLVAYKLTRAQTAKLTAGEVVDRIKKNIGIPWITTSYRDTFKIGGPDSMVTGIATSFGGNLRVLQLAQKAGLNMIIVHEPTFYSDGDRIDLAKDDLLYKLKLEWANNNKLVVWRIHDDWHAHKPDGIVLGWNHDLGWVRYQVDGNPKLWNLPPTTLVGLAKSLAKALPSQSIRIIGDPNIRVVRVAYGGHGLAQNMSALQQADCAIISEAREYDSFEYARDVAFSAEKGAIFISHEAGEDMGMDEFARWITPFVPEVRVRWIPTTDEFWTV
ncbi:MAG TPA: Nif3-like dinuclear metal center hexameric protein [Terriglobales bacterium]|nr:Nif3-like dinuclear metal center hexameric protein [Terriglobales bacterium]